MNSVTDLLYEAIAAHNRGMHFLCAAKARRAAVMAQEAADALQHQALCVADITPAIEFEPLPVIGVEDLTYPVNDLPAFLRRQAE